MRLHTLIGLLVAVLLVPAAGAHELQDNRATIVLRDKINLSLTLFINYVEALHRSLSPQRAFTEFLVVYAAMKPEELQKELRKAEAKFQADTKLILTPGGELEIRNWIWPDAKQVQELLQQRVMQAMVDSAGHAHAPPLEIHAAVIAKQEVVAFKVQFPAAFQHMLLVAFRPTQLTVEQHALSSEIKF